MARYVDIECDAVTKVLPRRAFKTRQDIQDFLDNIPTADVVPIVHGKWVHPHWKNSDFCYDCSVCGNENYIGTRNKRKHTEKMEIKKYCPCCNKMTLQKEKK